MTEQPPFPNQCANTDPHQTRPIEEIGLLLLR